MSSKSAPTPEQRREEELALFRRYALTRSPRRREEIIERFLPLARSLAQRYRGHTEPFDDLLQVASVGLVKAVDRFDPARGTSFAAYAVPTILGEIRRYFRDHVWKLKFPRSLQELVMKIDRATEELAEELGRFPSTGQLAERLELSEELIFEGLQAASARHTDSLDSPVRQEDPDSRLLVDTLGGSDPAFERVEAQAAGARVSLSARETEILRMRFGDELTQAEIAKLIGCSQMHVSRVSRGALWKLLCAVQGNAHSPLPKGSRRKAA